MIEFNYILQVFVIELLALECLNLSVEVLGLVEREQVNEDDGVELVVVLCLLKLRKVLIKEVQLFDCSVELLHLIVLQTVKDIVLSKLASLSDELWILFAKIGISVDDKLNWAESTLSFLMISGVLGFLKSFF